MQTSTPVTLTVRVDLAPPPAPVVSGGPDASALSSSEDGVTFECRLDGGASAACSSPVGVPGLAPGDHTLDVRAVDEAGNASPEMADAFSVPAAPAAAPTPTPTAVASLVEPPPLVPTFGQTVLLRPASGRTLVRRPGAARFEELRAKAADPLGSAVDVRSGAVVLTDAPSGSARPECARFYGGQFTVTHRDGLTQLALSARLRCGHTRSLWGDAAGLFTISGRFGSVGGRGSKWQVQDSCRATTIRVARGVDDVRDIHRRTTLAPAGGSALPDPVVDPIAHRRRVWDRRPSMRVRAFLLTTTLALLACAAPAAADTFNVTTTADPGSAACPPIRTLQCSIRAALVAAKNNDANGPTFDTINVPAGTYTLTQGQLDVTSSLGIVGHSANDTTIRSGGAFRVVKIEPEWTVVLQHLTIAKGAPPATDGLGGNIQVNAGSRLFLDHSEVTGGTALRGGGISISSGRAFVSKSLIDGNVATAAPGVTSGDGGGILSLGPGQGVTNGNTLEITDSTITANTAPTGGGIAVRGNANNASNPTTVLRSTIAGNTSTASLGGGIVMVDAENFTVTGSIVANNMGVAPSAGPPPPPGPSNCAGAAAPASGGANVESLADCKLGASGDLQHTDPLLSTTLTPGTDTPVLQIPPSSPAVDRIPNGSTACTSTIADPIADQRDFARPQGAGCDSGAYEADVTPPPTTIDSGPSGTVSGSSASFTFSSSKAGVTFQCRLDGPAGQGTFSPCTSPVSFSGLAPGAYTFFVRATDPAGNQTTTSRSFVIAAVSQSPPPPPPVAPMYHQTVVGQVVSGKVLVRLKGTRTFVPLDPSKGIPLGSELDTTHGTLRLFSQPKPGGAAQSALFYDGRFVVTQPGGITQLTLSQPLACTASGRASAAAKKPKTRKLWGDGSGSFRTRGQYSAATVRGTKWLTQDSCGKTLTRVARGVVSVRDLVKHKTVLLRAPHSYTALKRH
jgi:hypothetical protein